MSCVADINECNTYGICSQDCVNTKGSYRCTCRDGYVLDHLHGTSEHGTCKAGDGQEPALIFGNWRDVRKIKLHSGEYETLVEDTRSAIAVDFDIENDYLYWSDVTED